MIFSNRKTIGVFISKQFKPFDDAFFAALEEESRRFNCDVVVFTTAGYYITSSDYDIQEKNILKFAETTKLDGIIAVSSTYAKGEFRDMVYDTLRQQKHCPVVLVREEHDEFNCVFTDNYNAIKDIVKHVVEVHGIKKICYQTGPSDNPESDIRLNAFKEIMKSYGLSVPDESVCEGNFWTNCGDIAYNAFFSDPDNIPEAVVCANDYMAMGLERELIKHGYTIPDDVIITGFDNISEWCIDVPSLTTIQPDFKGMVKQAMNLLNQLMDNNIQDPVKIKLRGIFICGESCGCNKRNPRFFKKLSEKAVGLLEAENDQDAAMNNMSIDLSACNDLSGLHDVLLSDRTTTPLIRDHYICLFGENEDITEHESDKMCLVHAYKDQQDAGIPMTVFDRTDIVPPIADREEPQVFYIKLLHQNRHNFGYSIMHYNKGCVPSRCFVQVNVLLSIALENIHRQNELLRLYEERRLSSITDIQTGLLNRRGLIEQIEPLWDSFTGNHIAFICFDLDKLKHINDTYGHAGGDYAIYLVGKAIYDTLSKNDCGARVGGDEFIVFISDASDDKPEKFIKNFKKRLIELNKIKPNKFTVSASCGFEVVKLDGSLTMSDCINKSDAALYIEKSKRTNQSIDPPPKGGGLEER